MFRVLDLYNDAGPARTLTNGRRGTISVDGLDHDIFQ